jgi:hypothetical protein
MLLPPGKYAMLRPLAILSAMSLAASMRRSSIMPGPAAFVASEMSRADSDSPSALITAAFRSCTHAGSQNSQVPCGVQTYDGPQGNATLDLSAAMHKASGTTAQA